MTPSHPVQSSSVSDEWENLPTSKDPPLFLRKWQSIGFFFLRKYKILQEPIASRNFAVNIKEIQAKENWETAHKNDSSVFVFVFLLLASSPWSSCLRGVSATDNVVLLV